MRKSVQNEIGYIIDAVSAFCSITGFTIFTMLGVINPIFLQYKKMFTLIVAMSVALRYQRYVIPRYRVKKQDKPEEEAKGSGLTTALIVFIFSIPIIFQGVNLHKNSINTSAQNSPNEIKDPIDISSDEDMKVDDETVLIPWDAMIEEYILCADEEILSIKELSLLSNDELYYIRNGILAYAGRYFESGYYERFSWYSGNLSDEDAWKNINPIQLENIKNILLIEKQRMKK